MIPLSIQRMIEAQQMSSFRKMAQTIWPCQYRMVRVPGYRHRVLDGQIAIEVEMCIKALSEQKESENM
jgi:REP element-mobilizing transposase RayT